MMATAGRNEFQLLVQEETARLLGEDYAEWAGLKEVIRERKQSVYIVGPSGRLSGPSWAQRYSIFLAQRYDELGVLDGPQGKVYVAIRRQPGEWATVCRVELLAKGKTQPKGSLMMRWRGARYLVPEKLLRPGDVIKEDKGRLRVVSFSGRKPQVVMLELSEEERRRYKALLNMAGRNDG